MENNFFFNNFILLYFIVYSIFPKQKKIQKIKGKKQHHYTSSYLPFSLSLSLFFFGILKFQTQDLNSTWHSNLRLYIDISLAFSAQRSWKPLSQTSTAKREERGAGTKTLCFSLSLFLAQVRVPFRQILSLFLSLSLSLSIISYIWLLHVNDTCMCVLVFLWNLLFLGQLGSAIFFLFLFHFFVSFSEGWVLAL